MTIKISELDTAGQFFANTIVPVVGSVFGTLTTLRANGAIIKSFITTELIAADIALASNIALLNNNLQIQASQISSLTSNAGIQAGQISSLSSQIVTANVNLKGYVDGQIATTVANAAIQAGEISSLWANAANLSTQIVSANVNMKGYVDNQITTVIGGAPGALDTLNELANALGNDANFSTTVTNALTDLTSNAAVQSGQIDEINIILANYSPNVAVDAYYTESPLTSVQGGTGLSSPGDIGNVLISDGNVWVSSTPASVAIPIRGFSQLQVFESSGTFTVPEGVTKVKVTVVGGGGGGGGPSPDGGGGGGGTAIKIISDLTSGANITVTVGPGGTSGTFATNGGTSSFGNLCSATGGASGSTCSGGIGVDGDLNIKGGAGSKSVSIPNSSGVTGALDYVIPGFGGSSMFGGGGIGGDGAGGAYGGGGGGRSPENQLTGPGPGGAGAAGVVIVEY
jgi:hypothetical protein